MAGKTAVLIIHGVGPHTVFQACDSFVQGFCSTLAGSGGSRNKQISLHHRLKQRRDSSGGSPWIQSYVSFPVPESDEQTIDFYEYFWDIYMVHKPNFRDAFNMLINASKSAHDFYEKYGEKNKDLLAEATDLGEFGRKTKNGNVEFRPAGYLKLLGPFFGFVATVLPYAPKSFEFLVWWSQTGVPVFKQVFGALGGFMKEPVPDFVGDLVRYLDLDPRSERFEIRRRIMNGAIDELRALLRDESYESILIAGHSLGSVIAYDALTRVIQEVSTVPAATAGPASGGNGLTPDQVRRIKGLITFGSPLDKIALFFRERIKNHQVQQGVLANLRGFRSVRLDQDAPESDEEQNASEHKPKFKLDNPIDTDWEHSIRWLNFYHKQDIISGKLDLYNLKGQLLKYQQPKVASGEIKECDGNIEVTCDVGKLAAHGCYWGEYQGKKRGTNEMHAAIIKEFFA
ncbi:MAG: hypothetical protein HYX84_01025 [Chloroflexi bacterium]|nr:hypothetical protein [Chloroflexota bacterium]